MCRLFNFLCMSSLKIGILNVCFFLFHSISHKLLYWQTNSPMSDVASNQGPFQISPLFKSNTTCLMRLKLHYCARLYRLAIQVNIAWDHPLEI